MAEAILEELLSKYHLKSEDLDERISLTSDMLQIVDKIVNWKMMGYYLGIPETTLESIEVENRTEELRKIALIEAWMKKESSKATYLRLVEALHARRHNHIVEEICKLMEKSKVPQHTCTLGGSSESVNEKHDEVIKSTPQYASASSSRSNMPTGGFTCEFTFQPLECQVCTKYLRDPQNVSCCNADFCYDCIQGVRKCPICDESFSYRPNIKFNNLLLQFKVRCTHKCRWSGPLREHDEHLNVHPSNDTWLDGCPMVKVRCAYCTEEKQRHSYLQCLQKLPNLSIIYDITNRDGVSSKWEAIGKELSLHEDKLQAIKQSNDCYKEMLKQWKTSTGQANWRELLNAFRKPSVDLKIPAAKIEQGLLCDRASEQQVTELVQKAQDLIEEYRRGTTSQRADMFEEVRRCRQSLQDKTGDLELEKNIKLQMQGLGKDKRQFAVTSRSSWLQSFSNTIWRNISMTLK